MKIIPAIDLIDGENVRLKQGEYDLKSKMARTPAEAIAFYSRYSQVSRIHIVDLLGAKDKTLPEASLVGQLKKLTSIPLEIGGGLRDYDSINLYNQMGIDYFILGTRAIMDVPWLKEMVNEFPGRIYVGIDAKEEDIYINGWTENSGRQINEYVTEIESLDLAGIIYTDIAKDGMEQGPNIKRTSELQQVTQHTVIASGGVRHVEDLAELEKAGIKEVIVGKAANTVEFWEGIK